QIVEHQVASLVRWVERHLDDVVEAPLRSLLDAVTTIRAQDLEDTQEGVRLRQGVAKDRRISIEDAEMRHGRKSVSECLDGYKEPIAPALDAPAILACAVTAANRPEAEGAAPLADDLHRQGLTLGEVHIDRGYVNSPVVSSVLDSGGKVFSKPW